MKKVITLLFLLAMVTFLFTNLYATNLNNSTIIVKPYSEAVSNIDKTIDNTLDTLSIGIIVASIVIMAGVAFFYFIPKE